MMWPLKELRQTGGSRPSAATAQLTAILDKTKTVWTCSS